jgi:hypothetical protein
MRLACLIANATETHSENEIFIDFPQQKWSRQRASVLRLYVQYMSWCILQKVSSYRVPSIDVLIGFKEVYAHFDYYVLISQRRDLYGTNSS